MSDNPIHQAVELAKAGKKKDARRIIGGLIQQDTDNADAWIVMAQLVDDEQQALDCWQQVLRLRPNEEKARQRIEELQQRLRALDATKMESRDITSSGVVTPSQTTHLEAIASEPATKKCPYCAETILAEAIRCKYCGSDLRPGMAVGALPTASEPAPFPARSMEARPSQGAEEEQTILTARLSPWTLTFVLRVIFTLGLYLFWWRREELVVTNRRVIAHTGLIGRAERTALLSKVQDVTIRQGLLGRVFHYGTIVIETAGSLRAEFIVKGFENPELIKDTIMRLSWGEIVSPQPVRQSPLVPTLVGVGTLVACLACCGLLYFASRQQATTGVQPSAQNNVTAQSKGSSNSTSTPGAQSAGSCRKDTSDYLDAIKSPLTEFSDAFNLAGSTSRISLSPVIQNMQSARRAILEVSAPDCARNAARLTTDGMDGVINSFIDFEGSAPNATVQRELTEGGLQLTTGLNQLRALSNGQPTPVLPTLTATVTPRPTLTPTLTPSPQPMGSSIVVNGWEIRVTKVDIAKQLDFFGSTYKAKGRYAILFMTITNRNLSPSTFAGIGSIAVRDADGNQFDEDSTTVIAQDLYKTDIPADINPDQSAHVVSVFDISVQSSYYLLVPGTLADKVGWSILLDIH